MARFAIAALNADWSFAWSFTNDCHSHAVRESRASCPRHQPRAQRQGSLETRTHVVIRLEADFAPEGGLNLALVSARAGEERAAELNLDEHLRVER